MKRLKLKKNILVNNSAIIDIIPVDVTVNLLIASAWHTGSKRAKKNILYNCTSGQINKITSRMLETVLKKAFNKYPFENIMFFSVFNFDCTSHK